ncbi:hypothetical protein VV02_03565 [Luteipulveratus mongoliensis]|uniref:DUF2752 domain-containing protein n=2 Tax=Luteipulveratus mongoliensis TaxID=571913 RepID=A0A0K1JPF9_9MICO|nr:hypothetical protein VV02_03565 [Luteipulveratus mongoliensis]
MPAWLAGGLVAAVSAAAVLPPSAVQSGPTLCPFRRLTGLPCPTCGLTRSWVATAHGDLHTAFQEHILGPLTLVMAVALIGLLVVRRPLPSGRAVRLSVVVLTVVTAVWGVTRMILVARGDWSGPY